MCEKACAPFLGVVYLIMFKTGYINVLIKLGILIPESAIKKIPTWAEKLRNKIAPDPIKLENEFRYLGEDASIVGVNPRGLIPKAPFFAPAERTEIDKLLEGLKRAARDGKLLLLKDVLQGKDINPEITLNQLEREPTLHSSLSLLAPYFAKHKK